MPATSPITDADIEAAIEQHDDPDHPGSLTISEVRALLDIVQRDAEENWDNLLHSIEEDNASVVADTGDVIVLETGEHQLYDIALSRVASDLTDIEYDDIAASVVNAAMHNAAKRLSDYEWGAAYPYVIAKPEGVRDGEEYAWTMLAQRVREHGSVAAAVDTTATGDRGYTQSAWADATGRNQSSISRNTSE
ncbi:hypothetical protein [Halobacterium salinarum]|uniref:hypothetical protein n=1 Tax=Halobacterium salinarum TaxID=2242 RepID=UPI001F3A406F|nr:hypothetical protein [Halobacterium salinarum]MCF2165427.1 hypothetical protein [Halobacterium salinarum]MCF2168292.1 hypothetical protein [Halobacterium salinarum]